MRISHGKRFIYFSIPKTASESVRAFLDPHSDETVVKFDQTTPQNPFYSHMRPLEARDVFSARGYCFKDYFRFVTVRNPWARLASFYQMMNRNRAFRWTGTYAEWLTTLDPARPAGDMPQRWYAYGMMSVDAFVSDAAGKLLVDAAYRIEDELPRMCADLSERLGQRIDMAALGQVNRAPRSYDWRDMYGPEERALVARLYADEIEQFSYDF